MKVRTLLISIEVETDRKISDVKWEIKDLLEYEPETKVKQMSIMVADKTK